MSGKRLAATLMGVVLVASTAARARTRLLKGTSEEARTIPQGCGLV